MVLGKELALHRVAWYYCYSEWMGVEPSSSHINTSSHSQYSEHNAAFICRVTPLIDGVFS